MQYIYRLSKLQVIKRRECSLMKKEETPNSVPEYLNLVEHYGHFQVTTTLKGNCNIKKYIKVLNKEVQTWSYKTKLQ